MYDYEDYDYEIPTPQKRWRPKLVVTEFHHPISQPDLIGAYLNQNKVWIDHNGTEFKIKDMEKEYLFNILSWLNNNYDRVYFTYNFLNSSLLSPEEAPLFLKIKQQYMKLAKG